MTDLFAITIFIDRAISQKKVPEAHNTDLIMVIKFRIHYRENAEKF